MARAETSSITHSADTATAIEAARKKWGFTPGRLYWEPVNKGRLDEALAVNDPSALGDLMNTHYRREEVIAVLRTYLDHPNAKVRFDAAKELFRLGSDAGRGVMTALLLAGAKGEPEGLVYADWAAEVLHQYRQPINPHVLLAAYGKIKSGGLKRTLVLQQLPEAKVIIAAALKARTVEDHTHFAGILRMDDAATLDELRRRLKAQRPFSRLMARWALAQCTGSEADLEYVINLAKQAAGLVPRQPDYDHLLAMDAFHLLMTTPGPQAKDALKAIAEQTSKIENRSMTSADMIFESAFAALYYIHRDYAYVDQKITDLMSGPPRHPDFAIIWRIAAERHTPELELLALNRSPAIYERYFIREQGRPADYWIYQYLSLIPVSLQPK